jgi:hypothetical protein
MFIGQPILEKIGRSVCPTGFVEPIIAQALSTRKLFDGSENQ